MTWMMPWQPSSAAGCTGGADAYPKLRFNYLGIADLKYISDHGFGMTEVSLKIKQRHINISTVRNFIAIYYDGCQ